LHLFFIEYFLVCIEGNKREKKSETLKVKNKKKGIGEKKKERLHHRKKVHTHGREKKKRRRKKTTMANCFERGEQ
jgi:hypothetical protein